jgi:hypothetical protein
VDIGIDAAFESIAVARQSACRVSIVIRKTFGDEFFFSSVTSPTIVETQNTETSRPDFIGLSEH